MNTSPRFLALLTLLMPVLCIGQETQQSGAELSIAIIHDDGGDARERYRRTMFEALDGEGCAVAPYDAGSADTPQLLFDPAPVSIVKPQRSEYRLIARARSLDGTLEVRGAILVHAATGVSDLELLQGKWISFVDKASWSGYRLPVKLLQQAGVTESNSHYYFVGNHVGAVSALLHKDVHVAVMAEPLAQRWAEQNGLSIVAVTDAVETGGWWIHRRVSEAVAKRCTQAITRLKRFQHKALPAWIDGFVRTGS